MAWTNPKTFVNGAVLTASDMNTYVSDNTEFLFDNRVIGQLVTVAKTDTFSTTSTSYVTPTGLTVSITPSAESSKILVMGTCLVAKNNATGGRAVMVAPFRESTNLLNVESPGSRTASLVTWNSQNLQVAANGMLPVSFQLVDSPNTTSSTAYSIRVLSTSGITVNVNSSNGDNNAENFPRGISTLTLMEVLA